MAFHSRIELSSSRAGNLLFRGNQARIAAVMEARHEIAKHEMEQAMGRIGELTEEALVRFSPRGRGNPGTLEFGGTTPPRAPGTLKRSWSHHVVRRGDDILLEIGSSDPVSEYVDKGTGLYATGAVSRHLIRPKTGEWLAVPAAGLRAGGQRSRRRKQTLDVRFLRSTRGTPATHFVNRAQITVRPLVGPILRNAAYQAKRDTLRLLRGA